MMLSMDAKSQISTANSIAAGGQYFTAKTGNANGADWQEEIYQKIKSMKEMYLSELNDLYTKIAARVQQLGDVPLVPSWINRQGFIQTVWINPQGFVQQHDNLPQRPQNEQIDKLRMFKITLERIVQFLRLNKHDVQPSHKEKLLSVEKHISFFLNSNRGPRKPAGPLLQGHPMHTSQPTSIQPFQQAIMQPSAVQSPFLSNLPQNQQSTQSARLAHVEERLGMVEERLERIEARSQNVETLLVDINKTLNDLVKIRDVNVSVKVSGPSWTCNGRAKRKHRVAKMIRKSCQRRRLGRGAVEVVSPVALHDDCAEDVQRKSGEEQNC